MQEQEKKEPTLEENFSELEQVIRNLENREISLEDSFAKYEEGMHLLKACHDKIDLVEKKVLSLNEAGDLDEF